MKHLGQKEGKSILVRVAKLLQLSIYTLLPRGVTLFEDILGVFCQLSKSYKHLKRIFYGKYIAMMLCQPDTVTSNIRRRG